MSRSALNDLSNSESKDVNDYSLENCDEYNILNFLSDSSDTDFSESDDFIHQIKELSEARDEDLSKRLEILKNRLSVLKAELEVEKEMCKRAADDIVESHGVCHSSLCIHSSQCFFNTAESLSNNHFTSYVPPADYNFQIDTYHAALTHRQRYSKMNLQRQLAMKNYQRQLQEVENMCNMELLKVKESVINLQPLRLIVSEWEKEMNGGKGDSNNDYINKELEIRDDQSNIKFMENTDMLTSTTQITNEQGDLVDDDVNKMDTA